MPDNEQIEHDMDKILIFMNDAIEEEGVPINGLFFNFAREDKKVMNDNNWEEEYFYKLLKKCISREYIKRDCQTDKFVRLMLTESGQGRAISASLGKDRHYELDEVKMKIMSLTVNGAAQIGHNNFQNNADLFNAILNEVERLDAPAEDKDKARKVLNDYRDNSLIQSAFNNIFGDVNGR